MNKSIKIFLNYLFGPLLFAWLVFNVYQEIVAQNDLSLYMQTLYKEIDNKSLFLLFMLVALMMLQWLIEAVKWQFMLKSLIDLPFGKAILMIFSGISFSIATPNRLGEFIGRVMLLPKAMQLQGTGYTFVGNFAQLIATCIAGSIGLFFYQGEWVGQETHAVKNTLSVFMYLAPLITIFCLFLYFKSGLFFSWIAQIKLLEKWKDKFLQLSQFSGSLLLRLLLLSILRYGIFLVQYGLIFEVTKLDIDFLVISMGVSVMLFWLAVVPTISIVELGLRWQFAILLFTPFTSNVFGLTMGITLIWLLNMILPAGIGAVLLLVRRWK